MTGLTIAPTSSPPGTLHPRVHSSSAEEGTGRGWRRGSPGTRCTAEAPAQAAAACVPSEARAHACAHARPQRTWCPELRPALAPGNRCVPAPAAASPQQAVLSHQEWGAVSSWKRRLALSPSSPRPPPTPSQPLPCEQEGSRLREGSAHPVPGIQPPGQGGGNACSGSPRPWCPVLSQQPEWTPNPTSRVWPQGAEDAPGNGACVRASGAHCSPRPQAPPHPRQQAGPSLS